MSRKLYMVEFNIPQFPDEDFFETIPSHREKVNDFMCKDIIIYYSVSQDRTKVWSTFKSYSESELLTYIDSLPLSKYMDYNYHELMFLEIMPFKMNFSLN